MRILGDHHDYYDCMQAQDQDKKTLWVRKERTVYYDEQQWPFPHIYGYGQPPIDQTIIGFCGVIYPWWEVNVPGEEPVICQSDIDVDTFVRQNYSEHDFKSYISAKYWSGRNYRMLRASEVERCFEECVRKKNAYKYLFEQQRSPVFVARYRKPQSWITWDAKLKDLQFFRKFPPPQAYQEICSFMANLAVPIKPIPKLDDKTMAAVKGFDKHSFRKDAIKKGKR